MKNLHMRSMVSGAVFAALICVSTMFFPINLLHGFVNVGDFFVILSGILLGGGFGALASAIGASLADVLLGYAIYAPATFVIKALMAFCAFVIFKKLKEKAFFLSILTASLASEIIMVVMYFIYETFLFGPGGAMTSIVGNLMQGIANSVLAITVLLIFNRNASLKKFFKL